MRNLVKLSRLLPAFCFLLGVGSVHAQTEPSVANTPMVEAESTQQIQPLPTSISRDDQENALAPVREYTLSLRQLSSLSDFKLFGISNLQSLEFTLPRNKLVTQATLDLVFTPSPALLPKVSHLRVYLNDELMKVVPIEVDPPGKQQSALIELDPDYLSTFNQIRVEFVGHYTEVCEDLAHSALWIDLSQRTQLKIKERGILMANELSFFPEPFLDVNDMLPQTIPFLFAGAPSPTQLETAAALASYFGTVARWRKVEFPVSFDQLPEQYHTIVFATNDKRPEFLKNYAKVDQPTVDLISAPGNPFQKVLLILGRNDADLKDAVMALTLGQTLFRGQSVTINSVEKLAPRKPYDAPFWVPTDRPVYFSELIEYPGQLEVSGLLPRPIRLNLNLPPDLFVWRNKGIPLNLQYRYTSPLHSDESRLTLSLNNHFVASYPLLPHDNRSTLEQLRLPVLSNDAAVDRTSTTIPAFRIGAQNQLGMDFSFAATIGASQPGTCKTALAVDMRAAIDPQSSIDFSGYAHYTQMPNLRIFANSGFPFSRMADLSDTVIVMPGQFRPDQAETLLTVAGLIGSQTGYPAYNARIVQDWQQASAIDADILWLGSTPEDFRDRPDANLLLNHTVATITRPLESSANKPFPNETPYLPETDGASSASISVQSIGPIAAVVGMQSPYFPQRSMVGLLATQPADSKLLLGALTDSGKRAAMFGTISIIRNSGVDSYQIGPVYYVGEIQWWQKVWFHLSERPFLLAGLAALGTLLMAWVIWIALNWLARRRLNRDV